MAAEPIKIEGLREFRKALRDLDADLPKAIRVGFNTAMQIIVDDARPHVPSKSGRARGSIKTQSGQEKASIKAGGNAARHFPWLDFGGKRRGRGGGIASRPYFKAGRFVWKSFGDKRKQVFEGLEIALADVARSAGLDVTQSAGGD